MDHHISVSLKDLHSSPQTKWAWAFNIPNPDHARHRLTDSTWPRNAALPLVPSHIWSVSPELCPHFLSLFVADDECLLQTMWVLNLVPQGQSGLQELVSSHSGWQGNSEGQDQKHNTGRCPMQTHAFPCFSNGNCWAFSSTYRGALFCRWEPGVLKALQGSGIPSQPQAADPRTACWMAEPLHALMPASLIPL